METVSSSYTVLNILNTSTEYLKKCGIENSRLNAERLLCNIIKLDRIQLYLNYDRPLTASELSDFRKDLKRRSASEPLQYIIGETEFFSLPFKVNPNVLIPRPETELLVEAVLNRVKEKTDTEKELFILEIGTGSGCISISLAKQIAHCNVTAIDISAEALKVAERNAHYNQISEKISFYQIDFLNPTDLGVLKQNYDVIVSNPPYISRAGFSNLPLEIKDFEPKIALNDNEDGYVFYRALADFSPDHLNKDGLLAMEVGMGQSKIVAGFMQKHFSKIKIDADLNGIERVVSCKF